MLKETAALRKQPEGAVYSKHSFVEGGRHAGWPAPGSELAQFTNPQ